MTEPVAPPEESFPATALGLDLDLANPEQLGIPVDCFVVGKFFADGDPNYQIISTPHLNPIEALGMLSWATMVLQSGMLGASGSTEGEGE